MKNLLFRNALIILVLVIILWVLQDYLNLTSYLDLSNSQEVIEFIRGTRFAGPLIIIFIMTLAVVFSPLPSAPIAIASGALYGHFEGTFYIFLGSLLGSSIAFGISRIIGFQGAHDWLDKRFPTWRLGNQNRLMYVVMLSRLLPFISFDLVSYIAGVTALHYKRFIAATAIGILPASFLLAHLGSAASEQSFSINIIIFISMLLIGGMWHFFTKTK